jgi:3-isopropylmalate/(R)-2-methylmalate dehydratase large subunit
MGSTFVEKALARAAGLSETRAGAIVDVRPDRVLSHDNTSAIVKTWAQLGQALVRFPDRLVIALDHAVPAPTAVHAQNHAEARLFAQQQKVEAFFDAGCGVCHQVVGEAGLLWPGQTILGADSHTTHHGWMGAFGAGIGRSEVAALWATGELWLRVPEAIAVNLVGALSPGVTAKDLSLELLRRLGPQEAVYRSLEIGGPGVQALSVSDRMTLANMMAEAGAKNAYLAPDDSVFSWLSPRVGARMGWSATETRAALLESALYPDPDASYSARLTIDLSSIVPMVAEPHSPSNAVSLGDVTGVHVDLAFIGTCTNGRLEDLAAAASVLRRPDGGVRHLANGVRLVVVPASREVLRDALAAGYLGILAEAGAMIGTPGCGPCMGNHMGVPADGETVISTANRNFRGRMGNPRSSIYLANPAVVAASAVLGHIAGPGDLLRLEASGRRTRPATDRTEQVRKASLGPRGSSTGLGTAVAAIETSQSSTQLIEGTAWVYGHDVNTDVIFPGKYTYTLQDESEMARHALEDLDPTFAPNVRPGDIVVAGRNFGCGSSREQAVTCLRAAGVRAIVASSFARIFYRNAANGGILPIVSPEAAEHIRAGERVTIDLGSRIVKCAAGDFSFPELSPSVRRIIEAGGLMPMMRAGTRAYAASPERG